MSLCSLFLLFLYTLTTATEQDEIDSLHYNLAVINLGHLHSSNNRVRLKQEKLLLNAMENIGFIVLTNHDVPRDLMDRVWNVTRDFFDTDLDNKMTAPMTKDYIYGYSNTEVLQYSEQKEASKSENTIANDEKEHFNVMIGSLQKGKDTPQVKWPSKPKQMKPIWTEYYRECEKIASKLLVSFARILDLRDDYFDDKIDNHLSVIRALNYPDSNQTFDPNSSIYRCSPHSDYGTFTFLRQDNIGGLQVEKNGKWLNVVSDQYDFVINLGDLMARWTNDRFKSTRHRVVNLTKKRRQSLVFFHNLNGDAVVETIPTCLDASGNSKYEPIKFRDFLEMKHHATQTHYDVDKSEL